MKGHSASNKRHNSDARDFASGMDWNKLPKEILATLGIDPALTSSCQNETRTKTNGDDCNDNNKTSPLSDKQPLASSSLLQNSSPGDRTSPDAATADEMKSRRVSFKDTPEKIPLVMQVQETLEEDPFKVNTIISRKTSFNFC